MNSCKLSVISVIQFLHIKKKFHSYLYVNYFHENVFPQKTHIFFLNILIFAFPIYASVRTLIWRRKWQPTPVFLPGESQGGRSLAAVYGVAQSWTRLKRLGSSRTLIKCLSSATGNIIWYKNIEWYEKSSLCIANYYFFKQV